MENKKTIRISENDLKRIIREHIMEAISTPSLSLIAKKTRLSELPDINILKEGIFKSYDVSFVVRYLTEKLNFTTDQETFANYQAEGFIFTENDDSIHIAIPSSYKKMKDLDKIMSVFKYTETNKEELNDGFFLKIEYRNN